MKVLSGQSRSSSRGLLGQLFGTLIYFSVLFGLFGLFGTVWQSWPKRRSSRGLLGRLFGTLLYFSVLFGLFLVLFGKGGQTGEAVGGC